MKLIGLTGGIGCGKTTVLNHFRQLGVPCFVADSHAAGFYNEPDFLRQIRQLLGPSVINPDKRRNPKAIVVTATMFHTAQHGRQSILDIIYVAYNSCYSTHKIAL